MLRSLFACFCLVALSQAQVRTPQLGMVRCLDGSLRPVYGLPASFLIGKPALTAVDAASFSDRGGIVSANGKIQLFDSKGAAISEFDSNDPAALVNIDADAQTAIAWLPASQSILHWDGTLFLSTNVPDQIHGRVTSIRRDGDTARLLVLEDKIANDVTVSLSSGNVASVLPLIGIESAAFQQGSFVLFQDQDGLEIEGANGLRRTLALSASDLVVERMASNWLHLTSAGLHRHWALRVTPGALDFSELPAAAAEGVK